MKWFLSILVETKVSEDIHFATC